jgi:signal transduction histidine kinase/CheY-like chemotaxis protein/streptogramin lyase/HPt (histidine-containing phosphotransfer) domain-containing protein
LSDPYVNALLADADGSLWIGTDSGGLNRLDPLSEDFTSWRHRPEKAASLSANRVLSLLRDGSGALWVGTEAGVDRFDPERSAFVHMSGGSGAVYALHEDRTGQLWAGTARGLFRVEAGGQRLLRAAAMLSPVRAIAEAPGNRLWLGAGDGLWHFDPADDSLRAEPHALAELPGGRQLRALLQDRTGGLWLATRAGLAYRAAGGGWATFRQAANDPWSLPQNIVLALFEDRRGVIWAGTYGGGLARTVPWKNAFRRYIHDPDTPASLAQDIVFPIHQDRAGMLWVGTYNRGLDRLDPANGRAVHFRHDPGDPGSLSGNEVRAILEDSGGRLWVGTNRNGLNLLEREGPDADSASFKHFRHDPDDAGTLGHDSVVALLEAAHGGLWVGTWGGGLDHLDTATGTVTHYRHDANDPASLSHDRVMALHRDRDGTLWIATDGGGLNRFEPRSGRFARYRHRPGDPDSLSHDTVEAIHEDAGGRLWLATRYGLNRFDPETGRFRQYFDRDGLADNLVLGVLGDAEGLLWISTNRGLSRFDPDSATFRNFHADDGPGVEEFNSFAHHAGRDGVLYFGGIHGIVAFRPEAISAPGAPAPVVLTGLRLFNEPVVPRPSTDGALLRQSITRTGTLALTHRQSVITFEFAALDLADPDGVRYAYRLQGLDKDWIETDASRRLATYTYLPPGEFRFRARARDAEGAWGPEAALTLSVQPPPWRTGWAYALYAAAALLLLAGAFHYYRQRLLAAYLARERDAAEHATRLKSAFLAVMSHEIRTPLNGVLGMLELLRNTRLADRQRGYVESIHYAGQALLTILNDILDYSRIEADRISFEEADFDVRRLIDSLVMLVSARAAERNLTLEADVGADVPDTLRGDPGRLRQVLLNLLGNAVKFTESGGVTLLVRQLAAGQLAAEDGRVQLHFEISDTGPGIEPSLQPQLFQDYAQADPSITRRYGGSGLGLAICKRLVEAQGGRIGMRSRPGEGATFWFELGFETATVDLAGPGEAAVVAAVPLHVLLVDDVEMNREMATGLLQLDHHRVEQAENGQRALELVADGHFSVVLMDVRMPGMDGVETTRRIRGLPEPFRSGVPIVGLTASVEPEEIRRCLDAGMNQVLRKPVTRDALQKALAGALTPGDVAGAATSGDDPPLLDAQVLRQHWQALGGVRLREIVARFRHSGGELLANLREAGERNDAAAVREASHRLAGAAGGLGCLLLSEHAVAVESDARQARVKPQTLDALDACFEDSLAAVEDALIALVREKGKKGTDPVTA